jgi:hypothetical protein
MSRGFGRSAGQDYNQAIVAAASLGVIGKNTSDQLVLPKLVELHGNDKAAKETLHSGESGLLVLWGSNVRPKIIIFHCSLTVN